MDYSVLQSFATNIRTRLLRTVEQQLTTVLANDSWARRESAHAVKTLEDAIAQSSRSEVIESIAYTWFNRFTALRYFDLKGWNQPMIVSPTEGHLQPEVLEYAQQEIFPETMSPDQQMRCIDILNGRITSPNRNEQVYRMLFIEACHTQHKALPFLFEALSDYTELLLPSDLLTSTSILSDIRTALTKEICESVEVLGWLYQYYIAERKDAVMAARAAVATTDIPAVTQLFTPNWIVRYLVENSLGRLWLRSHPQSSLRNHMTYYVDDPADAPLSTITVQSPEEIRIIDPACGSGHMLVYAFDLLMHIYEEQAYPRRDIPRLILTHNLHGIDLCPRAAQLAALALVIKARSIDNSFLRANRVVMPNITLLNNLSIPQDTIQHWVRASQLPKTVSEHVQALSAQFANASTFGSLITPTLNNDYLHALRMHLPEHPACATFLAHIEALSQRYHVVVANPPYMGNRGMNDELKQFARTHYPDSKSDLFAMFIERGFDLAHTRGYSAMVTMQSWMFLSSYEDLRLKTLKDQTIITLTQMGNMVMGIAFGTSATVWLNDANREYAGQYSYVDYDDISDNNTPRQFPVQNDRLKRASAADFAKIPGSPIAYWVSERFRQLFVEGTPLVQLHRTAQGLATGENARFVRAWHEVAISRTGLSFADASRAQQSGCTWFPYNKGGDFRRWYGNQEFVVNWFNDGYAIRNFVDDNGKQRSVIRNPDAYFRPSVSWSKISSGMPAFRFFPQGFIFDVAGTSIFATDTHQQQCVLGLMNSQVTLSILRAISPTLNFEVGHISSIPIFAESFTRIDTRPISTLIALARADWDAYETSWDFSTLPLLRDDVAAPTLAERYARLTAHWQQQVAQMQALEVENNRIFIDAYGLQDELTPDVPLREITLTCNPVYRYGDKPADELAALQAADTMRELLSYAVGCMFGRYSLDKPGLILANAGDGLPEYLSAVGLPANQLRFVPDEDGIIPITAEEWFTDDIVMRTRAFLAATCGDVAVNQHFIEQTLNKPLRNYFVGEFYKHHLQTYKKRPIYWLFKSPRGTFACLMAMHRYRPDTLSIILNRYVRQAIAIVEREKQQCEQRLTDPLTSTKQRNELNRQITTRTAQLIELREYERTMLALASQQIALDLDDGVKTNYLRFSSVLERIPGLEAANDS